MLIVLIRVCPVKEVSLVCLVHRIPDEQPRQNEALSKERFDSIYEQAGRTSKIIPGSFGTLEEATVNRE